MLRSQFPGDAKSHELKVARADASLSPLHSIHLPGVKEVEVKKNEASLVYLPPGVANIITDLTAGNIDFNWPGDEKTKKFSSEERRQFRLFDKTIEQLQSRPMHPDPEAVVIANLLLHEEEKDVNEALALLTKKLENDSTYLEYDVIAIDPLGRQAKGTLLQIAVMGGDVDLQADLKEEKHYGLVERIALIGRLTSEEITQQLAVVTSEEAIKANEERNERVLKAVIKFGEGVIAKRKEYKRRDYYNGHSKYFEEFQALCQPLIDALDKALTPNPEEIITRGYIFDLAILYRAAKWFEKNVDRFGAWWTVQSDVFWVNCFGKLQIKLSSRDAQVVRAGIDYLVENEQMPPRTLKNADGSSHFFNAISQLGVSFFISIFGARSGGVGSAAGCGRWLARWVLALGSLISSKNNSIAKLPQCRQCRVDSKQSRCLLM